MLKTAAIIALSLAAASTALASSDDAWAEFATEVETACRTATEASLPDATVTVDPFGSESYGLAVVSTDTTSIICVFDKQSKAVEVGGELPVMVMATE